LLIRTHRSYIINKNKVQQVEGNMLLLAEKRIPVSRANRVISETII